MLRLRPHTFEKKGGSQSQATIELAYSCCVQMSNVKIKVVQFYSKLCSYTKGKTVFYDCRMLYF